MSLFRADNIRLSLGSRTLFDGLTLTIEEGECVGLVGVNGSGKSTLLQIVAGLKQPDSGLLERRRGAVFAWLPQDPTFAEGATIAGELFKPLGHLAEAIAEHEALSHQLASAPEASHDSLLKRLEEAAAKIERLGGWDTTHQAKAMLQRMGIPEADWERPIRELSGGNVKRVAIAQELLLKPDLLILDEPTNHLDVETIEWLEHELDELEAAILLVTHDRYFLDRLAERVVELEVGKLVSYPGNFQDYMEQKLEREENASRKEHKRQMLIRQELAWLRKGPEARRTKRKSRVDAARKLIAQKAPEVQKTAEFRKVAPVRSGHTVLELRKVDKALGGKRLVSGLDLILLKGEKLGVIGRNGVGKTTLVRMMLGDEAPDAGEVVRGKNTKVAYFDQRRAQLDPDLTVYDAASDGDKVQLGDRIIEKRDYLGDLLFPIPMQKMKVGALSGGEKNRLLLARLFLSGANLLVLDEPTNDLDIVTLQVLEELLLDFGGTVILVTHDRYFLDKIATSILAFEGDGRVVHYPGNHAMYLRLKAQQAQPTLQPAPEKPKDKPKQAAAPAPEKKGLSYKDRQRLEQMERLIEQAEAKKAGLERSLADPELYKSRAGEVAALKAELDVAAAAVEKLYAEWQDLESRA